MSITKSQAQTSIKNVNIELLSLNPSTLISLFEIDVGDLLDDAGISVDSSERIFRFHNNIKITDSSIWFKGLQYTAVPIQDSGWSMNSKGTLPTPKLALSVSQEGIPILALFKAQLKRLNDLSGAKVTRIRTFAKFLDSINFPNNTSPDNFSSDNKAELPRDIFYVDRKSAENKSVIEFELASILDIENLKLPGRSVFANRCPFTYRGEGCGYEIEENRVEAIHGDSTTGMSLLAAASAVANDKDELISDIVFPDKITEIGKYDSTKSYLKGNSVWIEKDSIKYRFVAKVDSPGTGPPNLNFWEPDRCSKSIRGCKLRFGDVLPGGFFPGVNKIG